MCVSALLTAIANRSGPLYQWFYVGLGFFSATIMMFLYYSSAHHVQWKQLLKPSDMLEDEKITFIANNHPNLPVDYWLKIKGREWQHYYKNMSCAMFPNLLELNINQIHWQTLYTSNATIQLFSAYYDTREVTPGKSIRVLAMIDKNTIYFKLYCHVWYDGKQEPMILEVKKANYIEYEYWQMQPNGRLGPYVLECNLPDNADKSVPVVVSIVANPCDRPKNMLKVNYETVNEKQNFAVCVKGMDFLHTDISLRLIEWLELLLMLGADKVFLYELALHPNIKKVLNYYQAIGKVDLRPLTLPEGQINIPVLQHIYLVTSSKQQWLNALIPYNDCFYRNMNKYKYIVMLDIDEMIVPMKDMNWKDLMDRTKIYTHYNETYSSYNVRNVYFLDGMTPTTEFSKDFPDYMHMLQHVYRSRNYSMPRSDGRAFFDTRYVLTCHNNLPIEYSNNSQLTYDIPTEVSVLHHYRRTCPESLESKSYMNDVIKDSTIWRFKDELTMRVQEVVNELGLNG